MFLLFNYGKIYQDFNCSILFFKFHIFKNILLNIIFKIIILILSYEILTIFYPFNNLRRG
jgi:hypothetical protein